MPGGKNQSPAILKAIYSSPTDSKDFEQSVAAARHEAKSKYLANLRASSKKLQDEINKYLTENMEADKKAQGQADVTGTSRPDELEEQRYGEEAGDDDT
ncbi:hypothetical protein LTR34_007684 [Exophiala xenobiotica]|uniref:EKC/KEOPS complex subunit GON7 n=1 Tax=Vermiconidia calcicola TaxID=1690605 RepID=A0AAV9Q6D7_9PEZI|nr:hypothetical protein LTR34_007684 [Exophiala xenobiotica]KAK5535046.1 hypothetical protein LTR25_006053 [Vermiconidia calcicola]KAK5536226.1 hypothetical protein LTR23_008088 [Chaetothyriales sp. CCFEE 6169]